MIRLFLYVHVKMNYIENESRVFRPKMFLKWTVAKEFFFFGKDQVFNNLAKKKRNQRKKS